MPKSAGPFLENSYPISQHFGENPSRYAQFGLNGHNGIDIAVPMETTVLAGIHGVVSEVGEDPAGWGRYVKVADVGQNLEIIYAHLNSIAPLIQVGYVTDPRNPIGGSGTTGNSTGPHLHLGFGDTDSAGMRINRANGYYGWKNPEDANWLTLNLFGAGAPITTPVPSPTGTPGTTTPVYTGPTPPPYAPSFAGQTVSSGGNSFRSDNGSTWIFQGSDSDRAAAQEAEKKRTLAELAAKAADVGVYLQKQNLSMRITAEGIFPPDGGLDDAEFLVITGPYEGRAGTVAGVSSAQWHTTPGRYTMTTRTERVEVRKKPLPPAPAPLPNVPVPPAVPPTTPPPSPAPPAGTPPASTSPGTEPWAGKKAPTHKNIYNKIVEMFAFLQS